MARTSLTKHLGDDDVLAYLYTGTSPNGLVEQHLSSCAECRQSLQALPEHRAAIESQYRAEDEVTFEFLTAQRRTIYARMEQQDKVRWFSGVRSWATAAGLAVAMAGGIVVFEQHAAPPQQPTISDAQLAAEVGQFAEASTPQPAQPISALFEE